MIGKSIRVYLADATVAGIRYAELVNWTGQAIACPRNRLGELSSWPEAGKPGVYVLFEARLGVATPLNRALLALVKALEAKRAA